MILWIMFHEILCNILFLTHPCQRPFLLNQRVRITVGKVPRLALDVQLK